MSSFKQREEEGETQMRTLSARSQRLRSLASSYMDLSPNERRRVPTSLMHGYQFDERSKELYSFDENAVYKVEVTTLGKLRILNKIRDLNDVDKRHVFDDPFRYKVISPFRIISLLEVMNNANGMRQGNAELPANGVDSDQPGDQGYPGDGGNGGDGGVGPNQPGPGFDGNGDGGDNLGYPGVSRDDIMGGIVHSHGNDSLDQGSNHGLSSFFSGNSGNDVTNYRWKPIRFGRKTLTPLYHLPSEDDNMPYPQLNSAELEEDVNEVIEFTEGEQMGNVYEDAGVEFSKEFAQEQHKARMERLKEICQTVEQTSPEIVAGSLPKIYDPVVESAEEARSSSKEEREEIEDELRDIIDEVDDKLDDAETETKELYESIAQLSLDIAIDQDQGKIEMDRVNITNQMKAVEAKVNETNERNAQILSGSSGQEVNPIKVEVKVDTMNGASSSEFVKGVNKANNDLIETQQMINDYYESYASDEKERKLFEDKNNVLRRSCNVHYSLGPIPNPSQKSQGRRFGLDMIPTTLPVVGQALIPKPSLRATPVETVQEPVGNRGTPVKAPQTSPSPILLDDAHVVVTEDRLEEMRESVKGVTRATPVSYEGYKKYLRDQKLDEYFDETGECEYFYHRFQRLSDMVPETIHVSNNRSVPIPETIDDRLMNTINVAISLYLFKPLISASKEPLYNCCNNFLSLIVLLNENEYLTEEYEEEERAVFFDEVRIGKLMEEYEKENKSPVHQFFVKLRKGKFRNDIDDEPEVVLDKYNEIDEYIEHFKQVDDNQGTETYREYLHSVAMMTLAKFEENTERQNQPNVNYQFNQDSDTFSGFYPYHSPSTDSVPSWLQEQYYDDYVRAYDEDEMYYDDYVRDYDEDEDDINEMYY